MNKTNLKILIASLLLFAAIFELHPQSNLFGPARQISKEEMNLRAEYNRARERGDKSALLPTQEKINNIMGAVTKSAEPYAGTFVEVNQPISGDNINIVQLSSMNGIRALATVTEQRGQNVGRIWVAAAMSNSNLRDTIFYFRSDDNGVSWLLYGFMYLENSDGVNFDQMDMEVIEDNTGDKYIWLVFGLTAANGKQFIGGATLRTPNFLGSTFVVGWPGENLGNSSFAHFRPHITTDNAKYSNTAAVYICASIDSFATNHFSWFALAKCVNPYTASVPVITYFKRPSGLLIGFNSVTEEHYDIAFMNNGADSVLLIVSNSHLSPNQMAEVPCDIDLNYNGNHITSFDNGFPIAFGRVACSGGNNQQSALIVFRENYQNSGDFDIKAERTTNGGMTWIDQNIDIRRDVVVTPYPADLIALRNRDGRFAISYTLAGITAFDTTKYVGTNANGIGLFSRTINHLSGFQRPKAGFRLVNNDSCFVIWSEEGNGHNLWASLGCSGAFTIGIQNTGTTIPASYSLGQNYPNPFNPITNIVFGIPRSEAVKIEVYDVTGRVVAEIVNKILPAGNYKADFDASALGSGVYFYKLITDEYSEVKKMVLIK